MKIELKYPLKIDYDREADKPSRIFSSISKSIDTFHKLDVLLANCLGEDLKVRQELDSIELGSITTWLKSIIEVPDDQTLKNKVYEEKKVKNFFDRGRREILSKFNGEFDLEDSKTYQEVQKNIEEIANEAGVLNDFTWNQLPALKIADIYDDFSKATADLSESDSIIVGNKLNKIDLAKGNVIDLEKLKASLVVEKVTRSSTEKLIIKKADFLGESKWDFKLGNKKIEAKISDLNWMNSLHKRKIKLTTGDCLLVNLKIELGFDKTGKIISEKNEIIQVLRVENASDELNGELFE